MEGRSEREGRGREQVDGTKEARDSFAGRGRLSWAANMGVRQMDESSLPVREAGAR